MRQTNSKSAAAITEPVDTLKRTAIAIAMFAAAICYANVLPNDFCDDGVHIVQRSEKITGQNTWQQIWTTDYWSASKLETPDRDLLYRPVTLSTYRLVLLLAGNRSLPHHIVNIALHSIIAGLVVGMCLSLGTGIPGALAAGVFFAVMPIHTGVLNNVVGRADLLATLFLMLAIRWHADGERNAIMYVPAAVAAFLAMASKENGAGVLVLVPLFTLLAPGTDAMMSWQRVSRTATRCFYLVLPALAYFSLRYIALEGQLFAAPALTKTVNVLVDAPAWQRAVGVVQLWGMYWAKMFVPVVLSLNYAVNAIQPVTSLFDLELLVGCAVCVAMLVVSVMAAKRGDRRFALLSLAIVAAYLPTSNSVVLIRVFFAERIWYLPSVFAAVLIGMTLEFFIPVRILRLRITLLIGILVAAGYLGRCWIRNTEWRHNGTVYAAAYRDLPTSVTARYALGRWIVSAAGDPDDLRRAIMLLDSALEIDPGFTDAQRTIGLAYYEIGDFAMALRHLQIADMQAPGDPDTISILDAARRRVSQFRSDELEALRQVADRGEVAGELNYIRALRETGMLRDALQRFREKPRYDHSEWLHELAVTYVLLNERDLAIDAYERALSLEPNHAQRAIELAMLLLERRRNEDLSEAWRLAELAGQEAPGAPGVLHTKAELLALQGKLAEARQLLQEAISALPVGSQQRRMLQNRLETLGGESK